MKKIILLVVAMLLSLVLASAAFAQDVTIQVVGGDGVPNGQYEFVAAVMDGPNPVRDTYCTGSLIDPTTVITAAHCAKGEPVDSMRVAVGKTDLSNPDLGVVRPVANKSIHPRYQDLCGGCFDVAVLNFTNPVPYEPANIAPDALDVPKSSAIVAGYGSVDKNGYIYRDRMQAGNVFIRHDDYSKNQWGPRFVKSIMIGAISDQVDTCFGDSGGPLFKMVNGQAEVLGATSFGSTPCGSNTKPGVYTELNAPAIESFIVAESK